MRDDTLESLLTGLEDRAAPESAPARSAPDAESVLVVSCSMSSSEHDPSVWPAGRARAVSALTTLGNQTCDHHDGELVVDGSLRQRTAEGDVSAAIVVGHTACTVIEDAYDRYVTPTDETATGIEARLDPLVSIVADAFDAGLVDASTPPRRARHRLVEYNVVRQVSFLTETLQDSITVAGYVHDQDGIYRTFPDRSYLVALDGDTGETEIRSGLPSDESVPVASLLC